MSKLKAFYQENTLECGIDEAGAGPLAGPVAAGAVIWPPDLAATQQIHELWVRFMMPPSYFVQEMTVARPVDADLL